MKKIVAQFLIGSPAFFAGVALLDRVSTFAGWKAALAAVAAVVLGGIGSRLLLSASIGLERIGA